MTKGCVTAIYCPFTIEASARRIDWTVICVTAILCHAVGIYNKKNAAVVKICWYTEKRQKRKRKREAFFKEESKRRVQVKANEETVWQQQLLANKRTDRHVSSVLKVGRSRLVSVSLLASLFTIARSFFILFYVNYVYTWLHNTLCWQLQINSATKLC